MSDAPGGWAEARTALATHLNVPESNIRRLQTESTDFYIVAADRSEDGLADIAAGLEAILEAILCETALGFACVVSGVEIVTSFSVDTSLLATTAEPTSSSSGALCDGGLLCQNGLSAKADIANLICNSDTCVQGTDEATCCNGAPCDGALLCQNGWSPKADIANLFCAGAACAQGTDEATCCDGGIENIPVVTASIEHVGQWDVVKAGLAAYLSLDANNLQKKDSRRLRSLEAQTTTHFVAVAMDRSESGMQSIKELLTKTANGVQCTLATGVDCRVFNIDTDIAYGINTTTLATVTPTTPGYAKPVDVDALSSLWALSFLVLIAPLGYLAVKHKARLVKEKTNESSSKTDLNDTTVTLSVKDAGWPSTRLSNAAARMGKMEVAPATKQEEGDEAVGNTQARAEDQRSDCSSTGKRDSDVDWPS